MAGEQEACRWIIAVGAHTAYTTPGSPSENGYIESFNACLRDEFLNGELSTPCRRPSQCRKLRMLTDPNQWPKRRSLVLCVRYPHCQPLKQIGNFDLAGQARVRLWADGEFEHIGLNVAARADGF